MGAHVVHKVKLGLEAADVAAVEARVHGDIQHKARLVLLGGILVQRVSTHVHLQWRGAGAVGAQAAAARQGRPGYHPQAAVAAGREARSMPPLQPDVAGCLPAARCLPRASRTGSRGLQVN